MIPFSDFTLAEGFDPSADAVHKLGRWLAGRVEDRFGISMAETIFLTVREAAELEEIPNTNMSGKRFLELVKNSYKKSLVHPSNFPHMDIGPAFALTDLDEGTVVFINTDYEGYRDNIGFMKFAIAHELGHWIYKYYEEHGELPVKFSYVESIGGKKIDHSRSMWPNVGSWRYKDKLENLADAFGRYLAGEKLNEKERLAMEGITGRTIRESDADDRVVLESRAAASERLGFRWSVGVPSQATASEAAELVRSGGQAQVSERSIMRCALTCECWMVDELVGFAAIKAPDQAYVEGVFSRAGVDDPGTFGFEFGYAIVREDVRRRFSGVGRRLFEELVGSAKFKDVPMYATTRTDNAPMQRILSSSGFGQEGGSFQSVLDPSKRVGLWVRR